MLPAVAMPRLGSGHTTHILQLLPGVRFHHTSHYTWDPIAPHTSHCPTCLPFPSHSYYPATPPWDTTANCRPAHTFCNCLTGLVTYSYRHTTPHCSTPAPYIDIGLTGDRPHHTVPDLTHTVPPQAGPSTTHTQTPHTHRFPPHTHTLRTHHTTHTTGLVPHPATPDGTLPTTPLFLGSLHTCRPPPCPPHRVTCRCHTQFHRHLRCTGVPLPDTLGPPLPYTCRQFTFTTTSRGPVAQLNPFSATGTTHSSRLPVGSATHTLGGTHHGLPHCPRVLDLFQRHRDTPAGFHTHYPAPHGTRHRTTFYYRTPADDVPHYAATLPATLPLPHTRCSALCLATRTPRLFSSPRACHTPAGLPGTGRDVAHLPHRHACTRTPPHHAPGTPFPAATTLPHCLYTRAARADL